MIGSVSVPSHTCSVRDNKGEPPRCANTSTALTSRTAIDRQEALVSIAPRPTDTTEQAHREAPKQPAPHICGRCPARWSGANIAHCRSCHRTFTTPANFDKHRAGLKDTGIVAGECHDPEWNGLVLNDRGHWSMPGGYH